MATNKRVQVADLADAPKLQATIQSGGNYRVAVQQAGDNKMLQLARSLEKVNPILQNYGAIQDLDVQAYKDDLAVLNADELKKKLSQTEENIDKEVRKGNIPFLGSPLNLKRKKRALGKAAHDQFLQSLVSAEGRLNIPIEGDSDKTTAVIINEEIEKFVEENPALQGQFTREGFQQAVNPTILNLTRQYDGEKARIAKGEILLENTSDIYRLAKAATHLNSAAYDEQMKNVFNDWKELNAFNPAQQLKVIENVAEQLAKVDEQKAYAFLKWSAKSLKVGNAKFGKMEDQYDRMLDMIEREAEVQGRLDDAERDDKKELIASQFTLAVNAIQNTGKATFNGETFNDTGLLLKAYQETVAQDGDPVYAAQAQLDFEKVVRGDVDPDEHARREIIGNSFAYSLLPRTVKNAFDVALTDYSDVDQDPRKLQLQTSVYADLNNKIDNKIKQLIASGDAQDPVQASQMLNEFINEEVAKLPPTLEKRIQKLDSIIQKESDDLSKLTSLQQPATDDPTEAQTEDLFYYPWQDEQKDISNKLMHNLKVIFNSETSKEERKEARSFNIQHTNKLLKEFTRIYNDKRQTFETRMSAKTDYFRHARFNESTFNLEALRTGYVRDGFKFDPRKIEIGNTVLISEERLEEVKDIENLESVPDDIKEIAQLVGSDNPLKLIELQVKLHSFLNPDVSK